MTTTPPPHEPHPARSARSAHPTHPAAPATVIDCDTCVVRGLACHDCVVTVLLGPPPELALDAEEQRALGVLAAGGLVPPLRLVRPVDPPPGLGVESA